MRKVPLGKTSLAVSQLCFGALPMGPLQRDMPPEEGARVIRHALERGVNFIDTAQAYGTYDHIRLAKEGYGGEIIIATKSYAETYQEMERAIREALTALDGDALGIVHLHAARVGPELFAIRSEALRCLVDYKKRGVIRAVGVATHTVPTVRAAAGRDDVDVIFPLINVRGQGVQGGSRDEMAEAILEAHSRGKGLYAMKVYAGGNLLHDRRGALDYVLGLPGMEVVAIGMVDEKEVDMNIKLLQDEEVDENYVPITTKKLVISRFCRGCGSCLEACPNGALSLSEGKARVDEGLCILCGYCNPLCPEFAIRMV
ncbi:MAG: aldo/keto reductase [Limnochordia bacterium]|jgi:predicted aldo/keto reductase-like oxidoreductase|nr:4Fe-4S binding protein [Bacillota bacterium]